MGPDLSQSSIACVFRRNTGGTEMSVAVFFKFFSFLSVLAICCCPRVFSGCSEWASHHSGFPCRRTRALGPWVQQLQCMDSVALWHVGSSRIRNQTCVFCISRQILYHQITREALWLCFLMATIELQLRQEDFPG